MTGVRTCQRRVPISEPTRRLKVPQIQFLDRVADMPRSVLRQTSLIQKLKKTVEAPQVQFLDRVVNVPVMAQRQVLSDQRHQNTVLVSHVQLINSVVDVPCIMQRQATAGEVTQEPRTIKKWTTSHMCRCVPQMAEQIAEAPRNLPQELVLQRAAVEDVAEVSSRGESGVCSNCCHRLDYPHTNTSSSSSSVSEDMVLRGIIEGADANRAAYRDAHRGTRAPVIESVPSSPAAAHAARDSDPKRGFISRREAQGQDRPRIDS